MLLAGRGDEPSPYHNQEQRQEKPFSVQDALAQMGMAFQMAYEAVAECHDRDIAYALYDYAWSLKEEALLHDALAAAHRDGKGATTFSKRDDYGYGVYRGGFLARLHRVLPMDAATSETCRLPISSLCTCEDMPIGDAAELSAMSTVCLRTGDAGGDATELYPHEPEALARRWVFPYVRHAPRYAYCVRDSAGDVAGYVLGCLDSGEFHRVVTECYFPKMATHYPPTCDHAYLTQDEVDARASCIYQATASSFVNLNSTRLICTSISLMSLHVATDWDRS